MIVALDKLTSAMAKVKSFAQDIKTVPGVLLNIGDDKIDVCYSDGRKSIIESVDAIINEGEKLGEVVVPYQMFMDMLAICQPSGSILCDDLTITVKAEGILSVETVKYALIKTPVGDSLEETKKPVSKFKQEIKYYKADEDIRYGILSRMNYASIFVGENFDSWDKSRLQTMLGRLSKEDGKVCYFSGQLSAAFVCNLAHVTYIPSIEVEEAGFSLTSKMAKYLVEILSKISDDKVNISVEEMRYCKITTPDNRVGIWFEMAPATRTDVTVLKTYESKDYSDYSLVFNRPALQDVVKRAVSSDNTDATSLTFADTEDGLSMNIVRGTASKSTDFAVIAEAYSDKAGNLLDTKIPVSLKVLSDIIDNCIGEYMMLDLTVDESGKFMRCTDTRGRDENGQPIVEARFYTVAAR